MVARHEEDQIYMNWDPDAYGGYLDPAPGYQYEDGPIAESNFGFALSNSTADLSSTTCTLMKIMMKTSAPRSNDTCT